MWIDGKRVTTCPSTRRDGKPCRGAPMANGLCWAHQSERVKEINRRGMAAFREWERNDAAWQSIVAEYESGRTVQGSDGLV